MILSILCGLAFGWAAPKPKVEKIVRWPGTMTYANVRVGGLSSVSQHNGSLFVLTDDRGRYGSPRIYELKKNLQDLEIEKVIPFQGLHDFFKSKTVLDPEGLVAGAQEFFVSSEADMSRKPREQNRILVLSKTGRVQSELILPPEAQGESTGNQTHGSYNNLGPEGLSMAPSQQVLWVGFEGPLLQDKTFEGENKNRVPFYRYQKQQGKWDYASKLSYPIEPLDKNHHEIFRGVSEILALSDDDLLVLERSATLGIQGLGFGGGIFRWSCKSLPCVKKKVVDFYQDLSPDMPADQIPNFEGMAFLNEQRKDLLLISDNNFSKTTETVFLFMKLSEEW